MRQLIKLTLLFIALALLTGCARAPAEESPTPTAIAAQSTEAPPELAQESTPDTTMASEAPVDECLACHADKQRLIDNAKPEEMVVEESSGSG